MRGGVYLPAEACIELRAARRILEADARRGGYTLSAAVIAAFDDFDAIAAERRAERSGMSAERSGMPNQRGVAGSRMISTMEAADDLGVSERAVRAQLERGSLVGSKVGGKWFVDAIDLERRQACQ